MKLTITEIAIHPENRNPIFDEATTKIRLDDAGGGMFVKIIQDDGEIELDFSEVEFLVSAVNKLKKEVEKKWT